MIQQFLSWVYVQRKQKHYLEKIYAPSIRSNIIYNSHDMEATCVHW